jgi:hypothetical protein
MSSEANSTSDEELIIMLQENNPNAWEHLYDKYAPAMYCIICKLTVDTSISETIFIQLFVQLKENPILAKVENDLCLTLLNYTYTFSILFLEHQKIAPLEISAADQDKLIYTICHTLTSLKDIASILHISEEAAEAKLYRELLNMVKQDAIQPNEHIEQIAYNFSSINQFKKV